MANAASLFSRPCASTCPCASYKAAINSGSFLTGGKEGSTLDALLADAAVAISVALQHGVSAQALAKSVGRLPEGPVTPGGLDQDPLEKVPASPIGAALDLVSSFEKGSE